ncbi:hypothetical protein K377_08060 [Streptomyces sp. PsTaAH-137]|nr:hypothetical protein K377_08060 [Streptomyces sp. PsTaAH-137]
MTLVRDGGNRAQREGRGDGGKNGQSCGVTGYHSKPLSSAAALFAASGTGLSNF